MDKYVGVRSETRDCAGVPALYVNGKPFTSVAYMTYLEKFNHYDDFVNAGYNFFSVPILFSGRWISITDGFTPFKKGIFDEKGKPDFSPLDESVRKILEACPNAHIIPRVNICMPEWWEKENPSDVNVRDDGSTARESFYSEKWRTDAAQMLREFIEYVNGTDYVSHIIGYQLAGGNTEEWFHYDMNAGCCKNAENGFRSYLKNYYPSVEYKGLPDLSKLKMKSVFFNNEYLTMFLEYASFAVADAITYFACVAKEASGNNVVVGSFYGYSLEVMSPLHGTHALKILLNDKNIDFICSPNSYLGIRAADCDWTEMYPADSVRLHGKMCFQECDIRTHLTVHLNEKDPSTDPYNLLSAEIWDGIESKPLARNLIRKSFARQLIKGNGLWWFDMWGGWYSDADIMSDMAEYRKVYENSLACNNRKSKAEIAVFIDESSYKYMSDTPAVNVICTQRKELGLMGTPYDMYDVFDFEQVCEKYKAVFFMSFAQTPNLKKALKLCGEKDIPYITLKNKFTVKELRAFCETNGIWIYCETDDIVYINENFVAICATYGGEKTIKLRREYDVCELFCNGGKITSDTITVDMEKGETKIFSLETSS